MAGGTLLKTFGFLTFSGDIEKEIGLKWVNLPTAEAYSELVIILDVGQGSE